MSPSPPRREDPPLLQGRGRFTDDTAPENALCAWFLRAGPAHARLRRLDVAAARALPGVEAILTAAELAADGIGPIPAKAELRDAAGRRILEPPRPALVRDRVRHSGEILAMVVARDLHRARDAAEAVRVELEPLPAVVRARDALAPGAGEIHPEVPGNLALDWAVGDLDATRAALARSSHRVVLARRFARIAGLYLEPRAAWADHDPASGVTTLTVASQGVHLQKELLLRATGWEPSSLRVLTEDVGGGFGPKFPLYPETLLVAWAARRLGRPVRWACERAEHFLADAQARDLEAEIELGLDAEGRITAVRVEGVAGLGAWLSSYAAIVPTTGLARVIGGLYRIPAVAVRLRLAYTTTTPVDAFRGAGKPEALDLLEQAVDAAAALAGLDPIELRRRNLLTPAELPWTAPLGHVLEPFDAPRLLDRALELADPAGLAERRSEAAARGRLLGQGIACHLHPSGGLLGEQARLELLPDGTVEVWTGTQSQGQGHATALAPVVAGALGLAPEQVRIRQGDTAVLPTGSGSGGSASMVISGSSLHRGALALAARIRAEAAELLEAAEADLRLEGGRVVVAGTDRALAFAELARAAEARGRPLRVEQVEGAPPQTWATGVTVAELEVDPETGLVELRRLASAVDCGTVLDPTSAAGQVQGGIAAGVGQALFERIVYDATGQLLTGSLLDYAIPRAADLPPPAIAFEPTPSSRNPLGVKGLGELPTNGALAAVSNAVADALRPLGVRLPDPPFTPERVWRVLRTTG